MKLSEQLKQDHVSGDFGDALEGYSERAKELEEAVAVLLGAAFDYVEYEHDGDPWKEDARAMGEMELNDLKRSGRLEEFRKLVDA